MLQFTFAYVADKFFGNKNNKLDLILNLKKTLTLIVFRTICILL